MASTNMVEVDPIGLDDGLNVSGKEERGAKNDSWAPGLSNRDEEELEEEEEGSVHVCERGWN